MMSDRIL